jgi:hypothetical protein
MALGLMLRARNGSGEKVAHGERMKAEVKKFIKKAGREARAGL